jgi:hypothetical protein
MAEEASARTRGEYLLPHAVGSVLSRRSIWANWDPVTERPSCTIGTGITVSAG